MEREGAEASAALTREIVSGRQEEGPVKVHEGRGRGHGRGHQTTRVAMLVGKTMRKRSTKIGALLGNSSGASTRLNSMRHSHASGQSTTLVSSRTSALLTSRTPESQMPERQLRSWMVYLSLACPATTRGLAFSLPSLGLSLGGEEECAPRFR